VGADQGIHLIDLLDQPCPGTAGSFGQLRFWSVRVRPSGGKSSPSGGRFDGNYLMNVELSSMIQ